MFERDKVGPTRIVRGSVTSVDAARRVCTVRVLDSNGAILSDVPWSSSMMSAGGDGVDFCPAAGYLCWVLLSDSNMRSDKDTSQTVLSFMPPLAGDSYGIDREPLGEEDIKLGTAAGARVFLDGGTGDLQLEGGVGASTTFFNTPRLIETITGDLRCVTDGGEVRWQSNTGETQLNVDIKRAPGDEGGYARVRVGSEGGVGQLDVQVLRDATQGSDAFVAGSSDLVSTPGVAFLLSGTQVGDVVLHAGAQLNVSANSELQIRAGYVVRIDADGVEVTSKSGDAVVRVAGDEVEVSATRVRVITGDMSVLDLNRGGYLLHTGTEDTEEQNKQLVTEEILPWLFNHTHPTPGGVSGAPLGSPADVESVTPPALNLVALQDILTEITAALSAAGFPVPPTTIAAIEGLTNAPPASIISVTTREDVLTQDTKVR